MAQNTKLLYTIVRETIPFLERDGILYPHINRAQEIICSQDVIKRVMNQI